MGNSMRQGRRSIRMKGFDYSSSGSYFVTICTQNRARLFGTIHDGQMILSTIGEMIHTEWLRLFSSNPFITPDEFIVMPDHFHGIIGIDPIGDSDGNIPFGVGGQAQGLPLRLAEPISLADIIREFKSRTTLKFIRGVHSEGWTPFRNRLWQRNYYERVIRNEQELTRVREYIRANPL